MNGFETLVKTFRKATKCDISKGKLPCNTCFHALPDTIDWQHVSWLLLLIMSKQYKGKNLDNLTTQIKEELKK